MSMYMRIENTIANGPWRGKGEQAFQLGGGLIYQKGWAIILFMKMRRGMFGCKSGQAMVEYAIVALALIFLLSTLAVLLRAEKNQAARAEQLVSSECP